MSLIVYLEMTASSLEKGSAKRGLSNFQLDYGRCCLYPWYLFLVCSVNAKLPWYPSSICCLFFQLSPDVQIMKNYPLVWLLQLQICRRSIWLIIGPAEVAASPKHCDLIPQFHKPVVFLLASLVNYQLKAFSGLSSWTIHVLSLVKLGFLVSN